MFSILIKSESRFPIRKKRIKQKVKSFLEKRGLSGEVEVSVAIVSRRKMKQLSRDYRNIDKPTTVLSFSQTEKRAGENFVSLPGDILYLGDVVVCYPEAQSLANQEGLLVDEEIDCLIEHGLLHLLGIHHD